MTLKEICEQAIELQNEYTNSLGSKELKIMRRDKLISHAASNYINLARACLEMQKALEFYCGGDISDVDMDIFDKLEVEGNGYVKFVDTEWLCSPARKALLAAEKIVGEV